MNSLWRGFMRRVTGAAVLGFALIVVAGELAGAVRPALAAADDSYGTADGIAAYLGVLPAQVVRGHAQAHPEGSMHGGAPGGRHSDHLVVALFDAASGDRIEDAEVTATVAGLGHVGSVRLRLEPMTIAGTVTYGEFVTFAGNDRYTISLEITLPGRDQPVRIDFVYRHDRP